MNGVLEQLSMTPNPALNAILLGHLRSMDAHFWPGIDGLTLSVVLDSYCQAAAAGHVPGKEELLQQHPALAEAIAAIFAECATASRQESQPTVPPLFYEHTD
jgi:hypothetical protein